ncbi:hypothetical protein FIM08_02560 [SAR202 cluster bacterium AC-647-N09_OGT_505m]|nr:hypothetical protein [SAR202 cluster bacterium AC-647-N09_OGT_505m]
MSIKVIVSFEVEDFDTFKAGFDTGENARTEAGIAAEAFKNMDAPSNVWVVGTAPSKETFISFFSAPTAQERMRNAGVISAPTITLLES